MKLKTNLFQGKKPSLEEGQMIYTVNDEDTVAGSDERSRGCRICLQLMKVIFYALLLLFMLFLVWIGFALVSQTLAPAEPRMCGTDLFYDYLEPIDNASNSTEIDDMIVSVDRTEPVTGYMSDFMEIETSADADEGRTADVKSVTYNEAKEYMRQALQ